MTDGETSRPAGPSCDGDAGPPATTDTAADAAPVTAGPSADRGPTAAIGRRGADRDVRRQRRVVERPWLGGRDAGSDDVLGQRFGRQPPGPAVQRPPGPAVGRQPGPGQQNRHNNNAGNQQGNDRGRQPTGSAPAGPRARPDRGAAGPAGRDRPGAVVPGRTGRGRACSTCATRATASSAATGTCRRRKDVYVSISQARRFALRKGDYVEGACRPASNNEKYPALLRIDTVSGLDPEEARNRPRFEDLTPLFPDSQLSWRYPGPRRT